MDRNNSFHQHSLSQGPLPISCLGILQIKDCNKDNILLIMMSYADIYRMDKKCFWCFGCPCWHFHTLLQLIIILCHLGMANTWDPCRQDVFWEREKKLLSASWLPLLRLSKVANIYASHGGTSPFLVGSTLISNFDPCTVATISCNKDGLVTSSNLPLQEDKSFDVKLVKYQRKALQP